jgi:hypothetical protein
MAMIQSTYHRALPFIFFLLSSLQVLENFAPGDTVRGSRNQKNKFCSGPRAIPDILPSFSRGGLEGMGFLLPKVLYEGIQDLSINFIDRKEIIANDFSSQGQAAWFFCI